ncbi:MAG: SRPBCC family protein [Saprospiraceae bacterium]|nr:SRPBCC family protein [Saprospiraceae bacterium]MBK8450065.1 SRPBCC family protein [Saprospiraceae bacterium]MBK9221293.1 SRPBCC family protein [Saprospiraceae bacterium]MBK9721772.1 SRPBCC family protein [Saprospiraceae bacterium]
MAFYQFKFTQKIPSQLNEVWNFMASPVNLKEITPDYMHFQITSIQKTPVMYPGMIISYKISPFFGLKLLWVTEITQVKENCYFVDEQRIGPYSMWHHEHHIEEIEGGVLMIDIVSYQPPYGFIGAIANFIFIRRKLLEIFNYRELAIRKKFGSLI